MASYIKTINNQCFDDIIKRVDYYNKLELHSVLGNNSNFCVSDTCTIKEFKFTDRSLYYCDLKPLTKFFLKSCVISYIFEDIVISPKFCSFVKSRRIGVNNKNSVILKLDSFRHFKFIFDKIPYKKKKNIAVWRGCCHAHKNRNDFVKKFYENSLIDAGDSDKKMKGTQFYKGFMSLQKQLHYKFIVSLQGNDVATNTKWIMSSNSLCFMPKPTVETWFREGTLLPNYHYVAIKDDYSDLQEKIDYYYKNEDEASCIIANAHQYIEKFTNNKKELLISILVMKKFFKMTNQIC
jgi:hypothetical protein